MSIELLKAQKLNKIKSRIQNQGYEFSLELKDSFEMGISVYNRSFTTMEVDQAAVTKPIIIQKETIPFREPRILKYQQRILDISTQLSQSQEQNNHHHSNDSILIQQEIEPLLNKVQTIAAIQDSQKQQQSTQEILLIYQEILRLPLNKIKIVCDSIDFSLWPEENLCDLLGSFLKEENLNHSVGNIIIQSSLLPLVIRLSSSLSRILMNSLLDLGKQYGNIVMDGLILPILNDVYEGKIEFGRPQIELFTKLINNSFPTSTRITLLNYLAFEYHQKILSTNNNSSQHHQQSASNHIIQFINTIVSSQPPITLNETMLRQLLQIAQSVIEIQPKDKGCMQLLLTLINKHAQSIMETNVLGDLENVAKQSDMFLKKSILGQVSSLRQKSLKK
ncbi:hypothetical protein BJ944DRAFT_249839 [Cunninghamella echinulata]|nr:hypothetical protein BJ944DRAFT_249839 [Cunninghamella echinulata]